MSDYPKRSEPPVFKSETYTVCLDCNKRVAKDGIHTCSPQIKSLSKSDVYALALEAGFMLSTQHGQADDKLMPVSDGPSLMKFAELVLKKASEK